MNHPWPDELIDEYGMGRHAIIILILIPDSAEETRHLQVQIKVTVDQVR